MPCSIGWNKPKAVPQPVLKPLEDGDPGPRISVRHASPAQATPFPCAITPKTNEVKISKIRSNRVPMFFLWATLISSVPHSHAALIVATGATTDMGSGFGTSLFNTVNRAGLVSPSPFATHGATNPTNSWVGSRSLTGNVTFSFGSLFAIDGLTFWNQNSGGPGGGGSTGIGNVMLSYSTDSITFYPLPGAPTFFAREFGFTSAPQQFSFAPVNARAIRFSIASNYGDSLQSGFAEVQFSGTSRVPDGGPTIAMLGLSMAGIAAVRRKLRHL